MYWRTFPNLERTWKLINNETGIQLGPKQYDRLEATEYQIEELTDSKLTLRNGEVRYYLVRQ